MDKHQVKIIQPHGILDATTSQELRSQINEFVNSGVKIVLIDFQDVTFMDSSGLGSLVLSFKALRAIDSQLFICSVNEQIRILFELTNMVQVFKIFSNRDEFHQSLLSRS